MSYHKIISFIKSIVRILGYLCLFLAIYNIKLVAIGALILALAEFLGIAEEWREK